MGAYDAAKDFAKAAITSGLSVDIIELLEKKRDLLLEEVADLEKDKAKLKTENESLKKQVSDLQKQLGDIFPDEKSLNPACQKFLDLMFQAGGSLSSYRLQSGLNVAEAMVQHYSDVLIDAKMIDVVGYLPDGGLTWALTKKGRSYGAQRVESQ